jgi:hypothetical protein
MEVCLRVKGGGRWGGQQQKFTTTAYKGSTPSEKKESSSVVCNFLPLNFCLFLFSFYLHIIAYLHLEN